MSESLFKRWVEAYESGEMLEEEDLNCLVPTVPWKWEICDRCQGHGTHANPNIGAFTRAEAEEWYGVEAEAFMGEYLRRGGAYDVQCEAGCQNGKIEVLDEERATSDQLRSWEQWQEAHYETQHEYDMERRMGA